MPFKRKEFPEITWENIAPPYRDYAYFKDCESHPFRFNADTFDMVNAWWLVEAATLVYADEAFVGERFAEAGLNEVEFFSEKGTDCFVASNRQFAIVAFRGTESRRREGESSFENIVIDLKTDLKIRLVDWGPGGKVHEGFNQALDQVWEKKGLRRTIQTLREGHRRIWITGHSLGAALATLAAYRYGHFQGLHTFGSPRVGDAGFKRVFDGKGKAWRFVNNSDIVPRVPPPVLYQHVGELKYIDSNGIVHHDTDRWERPANGISSQIRSFLESIGRGREGFSGMIPEALQDHVPTLYAIHIWNNIPVAAIIPERSNRESA